jgi:hypothetical protein
MKRFLAVLAIVALVFSSTAHASAGFGPPQMLDTTWVVAPFATPSAPAEGVSVDGAGRVYVGAGLAGIFRFDIRGAGGLWSTAAGFAQATLPDGRTFAPSRDVLSNSYIWNVAPDGSYAPLVSASPGEGWSYSTVSASGKLYVNIWAGQGQGIYAVDTNTGATTPIVTGGPGPGGSGVFSSMTTIGEDVYVVGLGTINGIYEVSGNSLVLRGSMPQGFVGLCAGPDAFYVTSGDATGGQVWRVAGNVATMFARYFGNTVSIAYDPPRNRFYVQDSTDPKVWVISRAPTAARSVSIGRIKALYK